MKMMSRTSITSTIGVTLISAITFACFTSCSMPASSGRRRRPGAGVRLRMLQLQHETALVRAVQLRLVAEQEVDELLRRVRDLHRHVIDAVDEVVVEPHRGQRDEQTERRRDE